MRKLSILILSCFILTGCSILPRMSFDSPGTVPKSIDKSKAKEICKGKAIWDDMGNLKECSKGYYNYAENYQKAERKMTFTEKVKSYINSLVGFGFWGIVLLVILCPSLLGLIVGRLMEGAYGVASNVNRKLVSAIQKIRKQNADVNTTLASELDASDKKYIAEIKDKENIK